MASIFRQLAVLAVLAGAAAWLLLQGGGEPAAPDEAGREARATPVEVEPARAGTVERVVSAVGSGRALRSVELRFAASGRVQRIAFEDGDEVAKGDVLAALEDAAQRADLDEARAALAEAESAFERARTLEEQGRVTGAAFDTAQAELLRARAGRDRAAADLDDRLLRAPFAGVVGFSEIDPGAVVGTDTVIATLDDISQLDVQFSVPERYFGEVARGDAVRARTRIFPEEAFEGRVQAIDRRVDEVSRAFRVRARFDNPGLRLPAGVFMQVDLVLDSKEGVLAPEESLVMEAGATHLFVLGPEGVIEKRVVRLGGRRDGEAEVLEGVRPGERIVVRGVQKVRDGASARPLNPEPEPESGPETGAEGVGDGAGQVRDAAGAAPRSAG